MNMWSKRCNLRTSRRARSSRRNLAAASHGFSATLRQYAHWRVSSTAPLAIMTARHVLFRVERYPLHSQYSNRTVCTTHRGSIRQRSGRPRSVRIATLSRDRIVDTSHGHHGDSPPLVFSSPTITASSLKPDRNSLSRTPVTGDYRTNRGEHSDAQTTGARESRALLSRARGVTAGEASELSAAAGGEHSSDQQAQTADAATAGI